MHTSVSMAASVRSLMDTWCAAHGVAATVVVEEALRAWVERPAPVELMPGPRLRVGVRLPRDLLGQARRVARSHAVGLPAVVDAMVAAQVTPRPTVEDPRLRPPGAS